MAKQSVKIEGVEYKSRTAAAKALVAAGKTLAEAAEMTGMTYQTVYANTKGSDKVAGRRAKYRVLALGRKGKRTASEIAKKTGMSVSKIVAMLKKNGIAIVTKESKSNSSRVNKSRKQKVVHPENIIDIPEVIVNDEIPVDANAEASAKADMASAQ